MLLLKIHAKRFAEMKKLGKVWRKEFETTNSECRDRQYSKTKPKCDNWQMCQARIVKEISTNLKYMKQNLY